MFARAVVEHVLALAIHEVVLVLHAHDLEVRERRFDVRDAHLAQASVSDQPFTLHVGDDAELKNRFRLAVTELLAERAQRVRMLGSAAIDLAWVADGKVDASITLSNKTLGYSSGRAPGRRGRRTCRGPKRITPSLRFHGNDSGARTASRSSARAGSTGRRRIMMTSNRPTRSSCSGEEE